MRVVGSLCNTRTLPLQFPLLLTGCLLLLGACKVYRGELLLHASLDAAAQDGGHVDASERPPAPTQGTQSTPVMQEEPAEPSAPTGASACERGACFLSTSRDGCESVGAPGPSFRPAVDAASASMTDKEIYLGLRSVHLQAAEAFGLDLDATCTNAANCPRDNKVSCRAQDSAQADGPGCRDNAFAELMRKVSQNAELTGQYGLSESTINCELWRGGYNVLAKISGYNGSSEDGSVRVDWYTSNGLEALPEWQCPERYFARNHAAWASDAGWSIDTRELAAPASERGRLPPSITSDPEAFVREGMLVSRMPDGALLRFAGDGKPLRGLSLSVRGAWWIGRLEPAAGGQWSLRDGLIAGRVAVDELMRSVRQLGVCEQSAGGAQYLLLGQDIMARADVLASGESKPERACDALSFGIAFEAVQVTPGSAARPLPALRECCEEGSTAPECQARCGDGMVSGNERCDTAIARGTAGACPTTCPKPSPCEMGLLTGSACDVRCEPQAITSPRDGDGCCPMGVDPRADADCHAKCGNNIVEMGETCDPPESCPVCKSDDKCLQVTTIGAASSCNVSCRIASINECRSEDGCCPANCMHGGDNDCSSRCGDGMVEPGTTETCEPRGGAACPRSCDDGEACTHDVQTGSTTNCNVRCSHFPITSFTPDDGCCPKGATRTDDPDCR